ncbi:MAG: hypothetical protein V4520_06680 [Bacteroidota bacterium]
MAAFTFLKTRWLKILLIVIGALVAIAIVAALCINSILAPKLSAKLKDAVMKGTDSLYTINYSDLDLNVLQGKAVLYDITFKADTAVYHQMKKRGAAPGKLYELHVKRLAISGAHAFELYFKKKLNIGRITLNSPEIAINKYLEKEPDTAGKDNRTLYQKLSKSLKMINVGEILLTDINYKQRDYTGPKAALSELKEMDVKATDLLIDSATQTDTTRFMYCKDVTTQLKNYSSKSGDGLYTFKVKTVKLSTQTKKLTVRGVNLQPVEPTVFFKKSKSDRFTVRIDSVQFNNFDYITYQKDQSLDVKRMVMDNGFFEVYSNYNGKLPTTDRLVTFPNWAIRHAIKATVNIDTLDMKHFAVTYKQLNKGPMKTGAVMFNNISARFHNLTNDKAAIAKNNIATASLTSYFMGKGRLDLSFKFNLNDADYKYSYKGHLGPMDITAANPATMPLAMVKITSGRVKSLDFNFNSTQKTSTGTVNFLYNDLNVDVLRKDDEKGYSKKSIISVLANSIIIKHDNPDDGKTAPRTAKVVFIRPANFPFFKTVWLSLLNGIKACAGVGEANEKDKKIDAEKLKKQQEERVKKAKEKKEEEDKKFKEKLKGKKKN